MTAAVNKPPTIGPEAELQRYKLLNANLESDNAALRRELEAAQEKIRQLEAWKKDHEPFVGKNLV